MTTSATQPAYLVFENGHVATGELMGTAGTTLGELVFNTALTGYQEILSDPSYKGQIVLMTYPEMGNYGINPQDFESTDIHVAGFVAKHPCAIPSNWQSVQSLPDLLTEKGITGITGIDTRMITRMVREHGALKAGITTDKGDLTAFLEHVKAQPALDDQDLVSQVTCTEPYTIKTAPEQSRYTGTLVVVDFGIKASIIEYLRQWMQEMTVVPAHTTFETIQSYKPDGVLLSNGPGDPNTLPEAVNLAKQLIAADIPTFGICLGHQIISLACGAQVGKLRFGHHGGNHPVKDLETDLVTITSQNHGYAVMPNQLPTDSIKVTHVNLNDQTIAGIRHLTRPVASVQFHPEANPGPHDAQYLFERFMTTLMDEKSPTFLGKALFH